ncbi:ATP-binding protein [Paraburkholderia sp. MM5384-R2]|uniref:ATP-binding protein n=1 Tax=Paraburkholderia sp. MM5384-R2 TaxID=2723097 RepID=UPI0017F2566D|nr:ATP-binding protein [Paraburkholderia sp. MM5384-R2]MBB5503235.1 DNA replication protein DnaC [Paraburkholderia sp. MM5384-R2]
MNLQHERIAGLCAQLKLDCIATDWAPLAQRTATTDSSMADFLEQLLQAELGAREQRKRQVLTKLAALPGVTSRCIRISGELFVSVSNRMSVRTSP